MNRERLITLILHLESLKGSERAKRFDMLHYVGIHHEDEMRMSDDAVDDIDSVTVKTSGDVMHNYCQTSACIAGTTVVMFQKELEKDPRAAAISEIDWTSAGALLLDLSDTAASELFHASRLQARRFHNVQFSDALRDKHGGKAILKILTIDDALVVLRHLFDHYEVDWSLAPSMKECGAKPHPVPAGRYGNE